MIELEIDEASAKIRTGPPGDASADMDLPVWAGELPITTSFGEPVPDAACSLPGARVHSGVRAAGLTRRLRSDPDLNARYAQ